MQVASQPSPIIGRRSGGNGRIATRRLRPIVVAIAARAVTALFGGYALAAAAATLAARLLPIDRAEATAWSMTLSFLVFVAAGLWCFHEPRLARVALLVWGGAILFGGAAYLLGVRP